MDDILRRLGDVETEVSDIRVDVSGIKADVAGIKAVIPHLATKADVSDVKASIIQWMVATTIAAVAAAGGLAFSIAKFVH